MKKTIKFLILWLAVLTVALVYFGDPGFLIVGLVLVQVLLLIYVLRGGKVS